MYIYAFIYRVYSLRRGGALEKRVSHIKLVMVLSFQISQESCFKDIEKRKGRLIVKNQSYLHIGFAGSIRRRAKEKETEGIEPDITRFCSVFFLIIFAPNLEDVIDDASVEEDDIATYVPTLSTSFQLIYHTLSAL